MLVVALAVLVGLLIGSFLNVCIYRMPRDLSVVKPRSFCPACEKTVSWFDNIPVLSYVVLGGRCRHCRAPIPLRYLLVEILTAVFFGVAVLRFGPTLAALKVCVFSALLIGLLFSDLEQRILPDEFTLGGAALGILFSALAPFDFGFTYFLLPSAWGRPARSVTESVVAALFTAGAMWFVGAVYHRVRHREGLGLGDVKMVAMMGTFLGVQRTLLALIAGSVLGSVVGLIYIYVAKKDAATYELPFGTFLGFGAIAVTLVGPKVFQWYGGLY